MRAASVGMASHLNADVTTLARLWRVTRRDGTVMRFTDAVRPIKIEVAPDVAPQVYRSDVSFTASAIFTSRSASSAQSVSMTFLMSDDGFNESQLRQRLYDGAEAEVMLVNYEDPSLGVILVYTGTWGMVKLSNLPIASVEVVPSQAAINGVVLGGECYSQTCRASLGDARCKVDINALKVAFTVGSAINGSIVASALNQENRHWDLGFVKWLTGANAGTISKVQSSNQASTSLFLGEPPFFVIAPGDTGEVFPGCDKLRVTCLNKFNNVLNGRYEPDVPTATNGSDTASITNQDLAIG